jgi:branched-chain amino acid transport system permease protein
MSSTIILFLLQDGIVNGAIYALLGVTLVLLFAVTRVIFIPQGELVAWGALTFAALESGKTPGTAWLLAILAASAFVLDLARRRKTLGARDIGWMFLRDLVFPIGLLLAVLWLAPLKLGFAAYAVITLAAIAPLGPVIYRLAFQPLADASVLTLFIAAVGVHIAMVGLGLVFFGAEGARVTPLIDGSFPLGALRLKGQSISVLVVASMLLLGLYVFFERTLTGKALRATAINRLGARLVGIPVKSTGQFAFLLAAAIGAVSGILFGGLTTIYYDTGFIVGLKGFVAAIVAGLVSYPLTALAALAVGILEAFSAFYASAFKEVIVFLLIIPVLLWRSLATPHSDEDE